MIEFRAEHFSLDFEHEKKWYPAVTVGLWKIHHGAFYDRTSAAEYTHYGSHVFKWRKWAGGFK